MIVTLTANPSLDRTLEVDALERGAVIRATDSHVHAGGKGVNVARVLTANGHATRAVLPLGGHEGDHLRRLLESTAIEVVPVAIAEPVRTNVSVVEPDGTVTKLNAAGPRLSPREIDALVDATVTAARSADIVAVCGSLPPGAPTDLYARLTTALHRAAVEVAVDSSGPPFSAVLGSGPDVVKPNQDELAEATRRPIETLGDALDAARELIRSGVRRVLVTLGAHGALLVTAEGSWYATVDAVTAVSNVGAGDAALAGLLAAGADGPDALRHAVAWGTAAVRLSGTSMPGPDDISLDEVVVTEPTPSLRLS